MTKQEKAIRSTGWRTDFLLGFPDGLLVILFSSQLLWDKGLNVQDFYYIHFIIIAAVTALLVVTTFFANRGNADHDGGTMTPEEKQKLKKLDIADHVIDHIGTEMEEDQKKWEDMLVKEQVQEVHYHPPSAFRSAVLTGFFFIVGAFLPLLPFFINENFEAASRAGLMTGLLAMLVFAYVKSRMTKQRPIPMAIRQMLIGGAVVLGVYIISLAWNMA
ncbi:VIT1/CCC1 transporter family protein [Chitinophaga horti]|uniref:VIT1/CCC1 transporter family protein n=1 Tax=Chitinophaga horti TaxID=2920382 RepID=A0ABY6J5X9_9BACT|nr:VIT1/CCC1 transporter family protein [Chitinophaga horti]UYQ95090.1 VIT1/CCC1 transporter family protein [Chitinophaga horti]